MFTAEVFFKDGERIKFNAKYAGIHPDYGDGKIYFIRDENEIQTEFPVDNTKYIQFGPGRYPTKEEEGEKANG